MNDFVKVIDKKRHGAPAEINPSFGKGGHALVVGGGMAGLLAARVLSDHFEQVTLLERDHLPKGPEPRRGIPQSRHLHVLVMRGRLILKELFPGIEEDLLARGADLIDVAGDSAILTPAGWGIRFRSGLPFLMCSRDLLEWSVRERVATLEQVRFLERAEATSLLLTTDGASVAGMKVRFRDGRNSGVGNEEPVYADLVVDTSGRNSDAPRWLQALGYPLPKETVVNARLGYATRLYEQPDGFAEDWKALYVQVAPPEITRGGTLFPLEGNRWICTLAGTGGDYPPTDERGFMEFAHSLRTPLLYKTIQDAKPLTAITGYRATENRRRHYEKLSRQPENFLILGDAACTFNPVYGQGMTTAALGAMALEKCLREQRNGNTIGLAQRFQKKLAKANATPWLLATGQDLRVRGTEGGTPGLTTRLTHRYMDRALPLSTRDTAVRQTFLEVFHMLKPSTALFRPGIALRVLRQVLIRRGGQ